MNNLVLVNDCQGGSGFKKDASEQKKLLAYTDDQNVLQKLSEIKKQNKEALAAWLLQKQGVKLNTNAMFTIQSKRLHEYKRQQLNLLFLIHQYLEIKAGHTPSVPLVSIFGSKTDLLGEITCRDHHLSSRNIVVFYKDKLHPFGNFRVILDHLRKGEESMDDVFGDGICRSCFGTKDTYQRNGRCKCRNLRSSWK